MDAIYKSISLILNLGKILYNNPNANRYLKKILTYNDFRLLKYYINTRGQQIDPCEYEEIENNNEYNISTHLIPFFINNVFKNRIQNQYYIILADSGMGKSTFLIMLFKKYYNKAFKSFDIKLIPLFYRNCIEQIHNIEHPQNTILLLDGLDENEDAIRDYKDFIKTLLESTQSFYKVIITCRTQFFPNEKSEPYETGQMQFNFNNKRSYFYKIYISPFTQKDIATFLKKRYPFHRKKREYAKVIVNKCPYLVVRPMLLGYIDELLAEKNKYEYVFQIYEQLIQNWYKREHISTEKLDKLTTTIALSMYDNNSLYFSSTELTDFCIQLNIDLSDIEVRSNSLLNRNGNGDYKFAHKSIYEYILAKLAFNDPDFRMVYNFSKLDMAEFFLNEMIDYYMYLLSFQEKVYDDLNNISINNKTFDELTFCKVKMLYSCFTKCNFINCTFDTIQLAYCKFDNCTFQNTKIENCTIGQTTFTSCSFNDVVMKNSTLSNLEFLDCLMPEFFSYSISIAYSKFNRIDLNNSGFTEIVITNCEFTSIDFSNSVFDDVRFNNCLYSIINWSQLKYKNLNIESPVMKEIKKLSSKCI